MSLSSRAQLIAFLSLVGAVLVISLAPIIVTGLVGKTLSDSLVAVSDKSITGIIGVLGSLATMIFRTNRQEEEATKNTGRALEAITAAAKAGTPTEAIQEGDTVTLEKKDG